MADLFDGLVARALGTAPALAPALASRFAPVVDEPWLDPDDPADPVVAARADQPQAGPWHAPGRRLPTRREGSVAPDEGAPAALVPGPHRPPGQSAPADAPSQTEPAARGARSEPLDPAPTPLAPRSPARRPEPRAEPRGERAPTGPVEVHREPERASSADRMQPGTGPVREPMATTPAVRRVESVTRPEAVHGAPATGYVVSATPVQITVSIGSVEVHAPARATPPPPSPPPRRPQPRLSLHDYLNRDGRR
jgi:hypothetical protein